MEIDHPSPCGDGEKHPYAGCSSCGLRELCLPGDTDSHTMQRIDGLDIAAERLYGLRPGVLRRRDDSAELSARGGALLARPNCVKQTDRSVRPRVGWWPLGQP